MTAPVAVCAMAALGEGEILTAQVNGVDVLVSHIEGEYHAIQDKCSHARQRLSEGRLRGSQIICPLHGARFDVRTGACLAAPATRDVKVFPVTLEAGKVWVTVNEAE